MNELQKLINSYLKFRENIPPINKKDESLILTSKDELNRHFDKENLKAIDIINDCLDKLNGINSNDGLSDYYLTSIYQDLLYYSFSSSGYPVEEPKIDNESKCTVSQLKDILNSLKEVLKSEEKNGTDIIDVIEDEFSKLRRTNYI